MTKDLKHNLSGHLNRLRDEIAEGFDRLADKLRHHEEDAQEPQGGGGDLMVSDRGATHPIDRFFNDFWRPNLWDIQYPRLDVENRADEVLVTAELPGMEEKDFNIELSGNRLTIRGERRQSNEKKTGNYTYHECSFGSFTRSVALPAEIDAGKVKADYKSGLLTVRLPKTETAKAKRIPVKTG